MITKLILPSDSDIYTRLTDYTNKVLETPNRYINDHFVDYCNSSDNRLKVDDPKLPGISDEFILNHDLDTVRWRDLLLTTCIFVDLYHISYPPFQTTLDFAQWIANETSTTFVEPRGHFLYPKGGYMGWHTNSDMPGIRVYATYTQTPNASYFKYVDRWSSDTPQIVTDWDEPGWTIRMFDPYGVSHKYLWHCVNAIDAPRISFGFKFK